MNSERNTTVKACYPNIDLGIISLAYREHQKNLKNKKDFGIGIIRFKTGTRNFLAHEIQRINEGNYGIFEKILDNRSPALRQKIIERLHQSETDDIPYLFFAIEDVFEKRLDIFRYKKIYKNIVFAYIPGTKFLPGIWYNTTKIKLYKKAS